MRSSQIQALPTEQKTTICIGLFVLVIAFCFPGFVLIHDGLIVLAGMTILIGRTFSGRLTIVLSILAAIAFILSGLARQKYPSAGDVSYFVGLALTILVAIVYIRGYFSHKRFKVADGALTTK